MNDHETVEYQCRECFRWAPWTDGEVMEDVSVPERIYWCQTCGRAQPLAGMAERTVNPLMPKRGEGT